MRYAYESYTFRGQEFFRIIDTFNGGKVVEKGIAFDSHAIGRRDELNALHADSATKRDGVAYSDTMSARKRKRVEDALADTLRFIAKEERYSADLQNVELLTWYRAHAAKLRQMLEAR